MFRVILFCALSLPLVAFAQQPTALPSPDYKTLYEQANDAAAKWKVQAERLALENADLRALKSTQPPTPIQDRAEPDGTDSLVEGKVVRILSEGIVVARENKPDCYILFPASGHHPGDSVKYGVTARSGPNSEALAYKATYVLRNWPSGTPKANHESAPASSAAVADDPRKQVKQVRFTLPKGSHKHLTDYGGPNEFLTFVSRDPLNVHIRIGTEDGVGTPKDVPLKVGFEGTTTPIYSDGYGCTLYWVETLHRHGEEGTFMAEFQPGALYRKD